MESLQLTSDRLLVGFDLIFTRASCVRAGVTVEDAMAANGRDANRDIRTIANRCPSTLNVSTDALSRISFFTIFF